MPAPAQGLTTFCCSRVQWSPCRLMWILRKTNKTHLISTMWWKTPLWYVLLRLTGD
uniref:Uncharacterized protein n=1 Tax=Pavo cristatus TaxID=9049 RepID=A0A8C9FBZ2_PAVCR